MLSLGSFFRGCKAANRFELVKRWHVDLGANKKFWFHLWTPIWHEGRGPYVSIGLYFVRVMRGY